MSKTTLYEVNADGKGLVIITGRFAHPTTVSSGNGFTVVDHGSQGRYDITFDDQYSGFISCVAGIEADAEADGDGWTALTSTYAAGANPTLQVWISDQAQDAQDLVADMYCNFIAIFRNTSVTT